MRGGRQISEYTHLCLSIPTTVCGLTTSAATAGGTGRCKALRPSNLNDGPNGIQYNCLISILITLLFSVGGGSK